MKVLVLNCGSSTIKFRLFDMDGEAVLASGVAENIGEADSRFVAWIGPPGGDSRESRDAAPVADYHDGLRRILAFLETAGALREEADLSGIGHRVVHGGERFLEPVPVDDRVVLAIREMIHLAPLHNPAGLAGIEIARALRPAIPQVAVFDTAFHRTLPPHAYLYALPYDLYESHGVRRYGFHGTSHRFVALRAAAYLGRPVESLDIVTLHLGNGASAAAIRGGLSVDTSMGLTPLEGLVMGTRSGDLDPAVLFFLAERTGMSLGEMEGLLTRESGLKGLCGTGDMREILPRAAADDPGARRAVDVYCHRIRKYVGAYAAVLGRLDAVVFTGGIGENAAPIRKKSLEGLGFMGIDIDEARNGAVSGDVAEIQTAESPVKVLVVRTNEELEIARQTVTCIRTARNRPGNGPGEDNPRRR